MVAGTTPLPGRPSPLTMQLGDAIGEALSRVGITDDRVARWLGRECGGCRSRRDKLNALGSWASRVARGGWDRARAALDLLIEEDR